MFSKAQDVITYGDDRLAGRQWEEGSRDYKTSSTTITAKTTNIISTYTIFLCHLARMRTNLDNAVGNHC